MADRDAICQVIELEKSMQAVPLTIEFPKNGEGGTIKIEGLKSVKMSYSINEDTKLRSCTSSITANAGDRVSLFANGTGNENRNFSFLNIKCSADCYVYGNVMSLLAKNNFENLTAVSNHAFHRLFRDNKKIHNHESKELVLPATILDNFCYCEMFSGCKGLTKAPKLPATILEPSCYYGMFEDCSNLVEPPDLPATILNKNCYSKMFKGCTSLENAPALPSTDLNSYCYSEMFIGCESLAKAPKLPSKRLAIGCYYSMFENCKNLEEAPELPATVLSKSCYEKMFFGCSRITKAPKLLATVLADSCYKSMFYDCSRLTDAPILSATKLAESCYETMFSCCHALSEAPKLPSTNLANRCYYSMFGACTGITIAPELPATTLAGYCYAGMFYNCTSLLRAPDLLANDMSEHCYEGMFKGCVSLKDAPQLPALTLDESCYENMFWGCTSLKNAPELPAKSMFKSCYESMFFNCSALTKAPKLPAMNLHDSCYSEMFAYCTSLTNAPDLPAPNLKQACYSNMFKGCSNLKSIFCLATRRMFLDTFFWLDDVSNSGTITIVNGSDWDSDDFPPGWTVKKTDVKLSMVQPELNETCHNQGEGRSDSSEFNPISCPLTIEFPAEGTGGTLTISYAFLRNDVWYSVNGASKIYIDSDKNFSISLKPGNQISFYGVGNSNNEDSYLNIACSSDCYVYGNVMSLVQDVDFEKLSKAPKYAFYKLFAGNTRIHNHSTKELVLPATVLGQSCYAYMFYGCTALTKAPKLPATNLAHDCFKNMFYGCTGLENNSNIDSKLLPLTFEFSSLGSLILSNCPFGKMWYSVNGGDKVLISTNYYEIPADANDQISLFANGTESNQKKHLNITCSSDCFVYGNVMSLIKKEGFENLTEVPKYAFRGLLQTNSCVNISGTKKLVLPATILAEHCYDSMFWGCSNLSYAPELPARELSPYCYSEMFSLCHNLTVPPKLPATRLADYCYSGMFWSTDLIEAPLLPATILAKHCYEKMFESCYKLTTVPELPGITLADSCYKSMFKFCSSLTNVGNLHAMDLADSCCEDMFCRCTSLKEAPNLPATKAASRCYYNMFDGCEKLTKAPELPATVLAKECYCWMFGYCRNLKTAPELPATTLADSCYMGMFNECTSLIKAPNLPAEILAPSCYSHMFSDCTGLRRAPEILATTLADKCFNYMFEDCVSLFDVSKLSSVALDNSSNSSMFDGCGNLQTIKADETGSPDSYANLLSSPLTFEFIETGYMVIESLDIGNVWYSVNGEKRYMLISGNGLGYIYASAGDKVCLFAKGVRHINCSSDCYVYGNAMSLVKQENFEDATDVSDSEFSRLFKGNTKIHNHSTKDIVLPATDLKPFCYASMFEGCTGLTRAPKLPAITMTKFCYSGMFKDCTGLTEAPILPARGLGYPTYGCYSQMFKGCSNLKSVTCLSNIDRDNQEWLSGVSPKGTFTKYAGTSWSKGDGGIPNGWKIKEIKQTPSF